jgi:DNA primase
MKTERLEFIDAVKLMAGELGIPMPVQEAGMAATHDRTEQLRRSILAINQFALDWFRRNLTEGRHAVAREYMKERDITDEMAGLFQLGVALDGWDHLAQAAKRSGFGDELLIEAGLCLRQETRGTLYDRFRNRLIFPIFDGMSRCIGFGGRRLDDDPKSPKYLNSAESVVYQKGKSVYALNVAQKAITESGFILLTEGYMDTLMAHRFGFTQAVATLGTALTPDQARLLGRHANRVFFLYDGDEAGQKAMLRGGEPLLAAGLDTRIISLPPGDDPDSFLRSNGPEALRELQEHATEYFDFALSSFARGIDLNSIAGQAQLVDRVSPLLLAIRNDVAREGAINRLLQRIGGLPREAVLQILKRARKDARSGGSVEGGSERIAPSSLDPIDRQILILMMHSHEALELLRGQLDLAWIVDENLLPWIDFLHCGHEDAQSLLAEAEIEGNLPASREILTSVLAGALPIGDPIHAAEQLTARLRKRYMQRSSAELLTELQVAIQTSPSAFPESLLRVIQEERKRIVQLMIPRAPTSL